MSDSNAPDPNHAVDPSDQEFDQEQDCPVDPPTPAMADANPLAENIGHRLRRMIHDRLPNPASGSTIPINSLRASINPQPQNIVRRVRRIVRGR